MRKQNPGTQKDKTQKEKDGLSGDRESSAQCSGPKPWCYGVRQAHFGVKPGPTSGHYPGVLSTSMAKGTHNCPSWLTVGSHTLQALPSFQLGHL